MPLAPDPFAVAPICTSGTLLDPDEQPSEAMAPGRACNSCHMAENVAAGEADAPIFSFAGTAYPTGHEPDNCVGSGAAGAVIEVIDARGMTFSAEVGAGGNFLAEVPDFAYPYTAQVTFGGRTRVMVEPQTSGDCNACHTQEGTNPLDKLQPAPGRILLP